MSASRPPRRRRELQCVAALTALAAFIVPIALAGPASAAEKGPKPGAFRGGALIQNGWWSRSNEPPPETGLAQPPSVPAPAAPAGTLPVALINGEPERIAALEFGLKGGADSTVTQVLLALAESDERGANINAELAGLQACPVTEAFWVGVENGAWTTAPVYDCEAGVAPGVRADDGVWTFDLTALASQWTASDRTDSPAVVVVGAVPVDPAQGANSFQVAFDAKKGVGLTAKATPASPDGESAGGTDGTSGTDGGDSSNPGTTGTSSSGGTALGGSSGSFGGESSSGGSGGGSFDSGDTDPLSSPDSTAVEGAEGGDSGESLPGTGFAPDSTVEAGGGSLLAAPSAWYSGLGVKAFALVVVALMLAYLVMVALGGSAQPIVGSGRRGVGRALERLRATRVAGFAGVGASSSVPSNLPSNLPSSIPSSTPGKNPIITLEDRT